MNETHNPSDRLLISIFLAVRLMMIMALPLDGLKGYSDLAHFYNLAKLGWPYIDIWVEFPPLFPFLSKLLLLVANGREHTYNYLLIFVLTIAQAGSLLILVRITQQVDSTQGFQWRAWVYMIILIGLPYSWWYFDPIAVFFFLLAIYMSIQYRIFQAGLALSAGILTKLFPVLMLPAAWRYMTRKKAFAFTAVAIGVTLFCYFVIYLAEAGNTIASIESQWNKGSWETIWALIDGNFNTGNIGSLADRLNPEAAANPVGGNNPKISPIITLIPFLIVGVWLFKRARLDTSLKYIAFIGLTWCIFMVWSPGWSPQWVMYLLPLILISLPRKEAVLILFALLFINLLEWPILISRGYQIGLWLTIPVRTLLLILLGYLWYRLAFYPGSVTFSYQAPGNKSIRQ